MCVLQGGRRRGRRGSGSCLGEGFVPSESIRDLREQVDYVGEHWVIGTSAFSVYWEPNATHQGGLLSSANLGAELKVVEVDVTVACVTETASDVWGWAVLESCLCKINLLKMYSIQPNSKNFMVSSQLRGSRIRGPFGLSDSRQRCPGSLNKWVKGSTGESEPI